MKIPCKECITFAICKSNVLDRVKELDRQLHPYYFIEKYTDDCPILKKYLKTRYISILELFCTFDLMTQWEYTKILFERYVFYNNPEKTRNYIDLIGSNSSPLQKLYQFFQKQNKENI